MSEEGLILKCRGGCVNNGNIRGFREIHRFNDHHIKNHMDDSQAKELVKLFIPDAKYKHCRHCIRNGKLRSFQTHKAMLAHHVSDHSLDQMALYRCIDAELPWTGDDSDDGDNCNDTASISSRSSRSSFASHYSTDSSRSRGSNPDMSSLAQNFHQVTVAPVAPPVNPPGMLTQQQFLQQLPNCSVFDYYQYVNDSRARAQSQAPPQEIDA